MIVFALDNLKKKPKDAAFFAFSIMMTTAMIMVFFCILNNPYFGTSSMHSLAQAGEFWDILTELDQGIGSGIFAVLLAVLMIAICIMTIFFSNNFYLLSKVKDIGIMMISGCTIPRITKFLIVQNFAVVLISAPIGGVLGYLCSPLVNMLIYAQMGLDVSPWIPIWGALSATLATLALVCVWLVIVDAGFVYRFDNIETLLKARTQMKARNRKSKAKMMVYLIVYAGALYFTIAFPVDQVNIVMMYYIGAFIYFGAVNVFRYVLPEVGAWIQRRFFSNHPLRLISLGNLQYSLASATQLVTIILLALSILLYYLCRFYNDPATFMVVMLTYVVVLILDIICIVYKMAVDAISKEAIFAKMMCIGYLRDDIKNIIHQEINGFYLLIVLVALPQMCLILTMYVAAKIIPISFMMMILALFLFALWIGSLITKRIYEEIILHLHLQEHLASE